MQQQPFAELLAATGSLWFEGEFCRDAGCRALLFSRPEALLPLHEGDDFPAFFARLEGWLQRGFYLAGWLGYEASPGFERALRTCAPAGAAPAVVGWFAAYREPRSIGAAELRQLLPDHSPALSLPELAGLGFAPDREEYLEKVEEIREQIAAGSVYQVNYTGRYRFDYSGSPASLYQALRPAQPAAYSALLNWGERSVLSFSPELFFRRRGNLLETMPMKGTAPRGGSVAEDLARRDALARCGKNRAENLMIVDLLRNDLGRVCREGSVEVAELFATQSWPTLHQMVSSIRGELRPRTGLFDLFRALFPCGSVTGAPKVRAMQLINSLEEGPRGAYTGAIGFMTPAGDMTFNVAIRTLELAAGKGCYGAGSGIVWDSSALEEYRECRLKGAILEGLQAPSGLFETMLWNGQWLWLEEHLDRLQASAAALAIPFGRSGAEALLADADARFRREGGRYKVRLDLAVDATLSLRCEPIAAATGASTLRVALAPERVDSGDPLLRHKRASRDRYDRYYRAALEAGFDEVLFLNEQGEAAEGAISTLFVRRRGRLVTPLLSAGILEGILRAAILRTRPGAAEGVVAFGELSGGQLFWMGNSVRGLRPARLTGELPLLD